MCQRQGSGLRGLSKDRLEPRRVLLEASLAVRSVTKAAGRDVMGVCNHCMEMDVRH